MSQRQPVEVSVNTMRQLTNTTLDAKHLEAINMYDLMQNQMLDVAATLSDTDPEKVRALQEEYASLLMMKREVELHKLALHEDVMRSYQPSLQPTKFDKELETALQKRIADDRFDPHRTDQMKRFVSDTGLEAAPNNEDEVVMEAEALDKIKCPLTGKLVLELRNPVEDAFGYIYEKDAIMAHLRAKGGRCPCPSAGTHHIVTADSLKPCTRIQRERRRQLIGTTTQGAGGSSAPAADDAFDAEDLDL